MARGPIIREGDTVRVEIPKSDYHESPVTNTLARRYNGKRMTVSRKRPLKREQGYASIYELEGATGPTGIPFTFIAEWLTKED